MPKVDPNTHEPISDESEKEDDDQRGGKTLGDDALSDSKSTGSPPNAPRR